MLKNYFTIAWRSFTKNKLYSFINIASLAVAIASCLLIALFVAHEFHYDTFNKNFDRIYSIYSRVKIGSDTVEFPLMSYATAPIVANTNPEVESYIRIQQPYNKVTVYNPANSEVKFSEKEILFADSNFFNFFSFHLKTGNPVLALQRPFTIVITEKIAKKYFGEMNPIGRQLQYDSAYTFEVTGIIEDAPSNSSIQYDFVASLVSKLFMKGKEIILNQQNVSYGDFQTFFLLNKQASTTLFQSTIQKLSVQGSGADDVNSWYYIIPLSQMHLQKKSGYASNIKYLNVFPWVAFIILMLALVNYMSLSSAISVTRSKEIGIRKVLGASRYGIAKQFYLESALYAVCAFSFGLILFFMAKPIFFELLGQQIDWLFIFDPFVICIFLRLLLFTILVAGSYPSIIISFYKPITVLYGKFSKNPASITIREFFTVFQFTISVILVICSIIIQQQLFFFQHTDTGVNRNNVIYIPFKTTLHNGFIPLRQDLEHISGVNNVAVARYPMYKEFETLTASPKEENKDVSIVSLLVDDQFIPTLDLHWQIAPQNNFILSDESSIVLNEAAISKLNLPPNPIGEQIQINDGEYKVRGVLKNFNYTSLTSKIDAACLFIKQDSAVRWGSLKNGCFFVKIKANTNIPALIASIKKIYDNYDKNTPFEFAFMDDAFNTTYQAENKLARILKIFTGITLCIAFSGLFGLAAFSTVQRTKEIGIRKVLGASVKNIVGLLTKDFIMPIILAIVIALPIAWFIMHTWLENFAYRVSISIWVFVISALITIAIAILSTCFLTIKTALIKPAKTLKTE